jgi:NADPH2:quinone reductase
VWRTVLLGKSMGLTVVGLSRSEAKGEKLKALGADAVFNPEDRDLRNKVSAAIAPKKVDIAVDSIGGALFPQVVAMLGYGGKISVVGRSAGPVPEFNTGTLFFRRNRIGGVAVARLHAGSGADGMEGDRRRLAEAGKRPVIDRVFPFEEVIWAFHRLAEGPWARWWCASPAEALCWGRDHRLGGGRARSPRTQFPVWGRQEKEAEFELPRPVMRSTENR